LEEAKAIVERDIATHMLAKRQRKRPVLRLVVG
jgi:hypothetical protein